MGQKRLESLQGQLEQKDAQESVSDNSPAIQKCDKDKMINQFEEHEEYQKIIVVVSEGNDTEVEQKMRCYLTRFQECLGLDKGASGHRRVWNQTGGRSEEKEACRRTGAGQKSTFQ